MEEHELMPPPPLPYTGPPPHGHLPRYHGQPLPSLALPPKMAPTPPAPGPSSSSAARNPAALHPNRNQLAAHPGLPYTGPPPPGHTPRYHGQPLPALSAEFNPNLEYGRPPTRNRESDYPTQMHPRMSAPLEQPGAHQQYPYQYYRDGAGDGSDTPGYDSNRSESFYDG
ncbi:hypothetical protein FB45DRAFT_1029220 [Roridomyces roridus]|uniref:Uncharacterized protein n=1 Tax=Roridomyces roridus TaxID=1738132 RepID=A0AAD7FLF5_9AGAR|nr:hypothetical protein FB45DRAFT_1029220 [Roridomyces roridus]